MNMYIENIVLTFKSMITQTRFSIKSALMKRNIDTYYNAQTKPEKSFVGF